jgi:uncharacterized protein (UPF0303 family)
MSTIIEEIARVKMQEAELIFDHFSGSDALRIGTMLIDKALANGVSYAVNISLNGRRLFHFSMDGATPDNDKWIERKENAVQHFMRSSYRLQLELEESGETLWPRYGLNDADYVAAGGSFPINVAGVGVVGAITVSGLPSEIDHAYVTDVIRNYLNFPRD